MPRIPNDEADAVVIVVAVTFIPVLIFAWASLIYLKAVCKDRAIRSGSRRRQRSSSPSHWNTINSKDPEFTAWMAGYLYEFGLVEEGDVYLVRTALIAPNNESTRLAELKEYLATLN